MVSFGIVLLNLQVLLLYRVLVVWLGSVNWTGMDQNFNFLIVCDGIYAIQLTLHCSSRLLNH